MNEPFETATVSDLPDETKVEPPSTSFVTLFSSGMMPEERERYVARMLGLHPERYDRNLVKIILRDSEQAAERYFMDEIYRLQHR